MVGTMTRGPGYYWVKFLGTWQTLYWGIDQFGNYCFQCPGIEIYILESDCHITEINEVRILNPDEI